MTVEIPASLVEHVRAGAYWQMEGDAVDLGTADLHGADWHALSDAVRHGADLVRTLDQHEGAGPARLDLTHAQAAQLLAGIDYEIDAIEDRAREAKPAEEIVRWGRVAIRMRRLHERVAEAIA